MNEIKIEDKVYDLPENWEEVKLKQQIKMYNIPKDINNLNKNIHILHALSGAPIEELRKVMFEDLMKIRIPFLNEPIPEGDSVFEIDGTKYGMIRDMKDLSTGEFADAENYAMQGFDKIHFLMAILIRPIIKQEGDLYILEDYKTETSKIRAELFYNKLNVKYVRKVSDFFQNSVFGYIKSLMDSSPLEDKKKMKEIREQIKKTILTKTREYKGGVGLD